MKTKRVFAAILSAMMIMSFMAGCSGNTADVDNSSSETSVSDTENNSPEAIDAREASGTVKELSQSKLVLALEDQTEVEFKLDDFEIPAELKIGDTITVNYTESDNGVAINNIEIALANEEAGSKPDDKPEEPSVPVEDNSQGNNKTESGSTEVGYSGWTQQQKAEYLFSDAHWIAEITDWTTPCTQIGEVNTATVFFQGHAEVARVGVEFGPRYKEKRDEFGYGSKDAAEWEIATIRLFNDYLGLPTDLSTCNLMYSNPPSASESDKKPEEKPASKPDPKPEDGEVSEAGDVYKAIELINKERVKAGLKELKIDDTLMEMAAVRADELSEVYEHTRPDGSDWKTIFDDFGIKVTNKRGENAYKGKKLSDAKDVVSGWMNSSGHKANILKEGISKVGVGYYTDGVEHYWIMIVTE